MRAEEALDMEMFSRVTALAVQNLEFTSRAAPIPTLIKDNFKPLQTLEVFEDNTTKAPLLQN